MSEEKYYMISNSDGDTYVTEYSKKELLKIINDENYDCLFIDKIIENDTNYWNNYHLIVKGKIVTPIEKKVVLERDIE